MLFSLVSLWKNTIFFYFFQEKYKKNFFGKKLGEWDDDFKMSKSENLDDKIEILNLNTKQIVIDNTNPHQAVNFEAFSYKDNIIVMGGSVKQKNNKRYVKKIKLLDDSIQVRGIKQKQIIEYLQEHIEDYKPNIIFKLQ